MTLAYRHGNDTCLPTRKTHIHISTRRHTYTIKPHIHKKSNVEPEIGQQRISPLIEKKLARLTNKLSHKLSNLFLCFSEFI